MIYITGDTHESFLRIENFCKQKNTTLSDVIIILGDVGININGGFRDKQKKELLSRIPVTFFCIHGNHEMRPSSINSYEKKIWCDGLVYAESEYPNILFAKDGEIFDFNGFKTIVIGGAYSIDKEYRLQMGFPWFPDEQPNNEIKTYVEKQLAKCNWKIDAVLSHTIPYNYMPTDMFLTGIDQDQIDYTTENWLQDIEKKLTYVKWYCGHYHVTRKLKKIQIMFKDFKVFQD